MAENGNIVVITGNLTRDARTTTSASGFSKSQFCVAVGKRKKNKETGEYEDAASFIDCEVLGDRATKIGPKLKKGIRVTIYGRLDTETAPDKDGNRRKYWKVIADNIELPPASADAAEEESYLDEDAAF